MCPKQGDRSKQTDFLLGSLPSPLLGLHLSQHGLRQSFAPLAPHNGVRTRPVCISPSGQILQKKSPPAKLPVKTPSSAQGSGPLLPWLPSQALAMPDSNKKGNCSEQSSRRGEEICLAAAAWRLLSAAQQTHPSRETPESAPAGPGLRGEGRS